MDEQTLVRTRRALHGVAELVIAGPQYRTHGTIRLRALPDGFEGVRSGVRVAGDRLVWDGGRVPLTGTCRELAAAASLKVGAPGLYADGSGVDPDEPLELDPAALALLLSWFGIADAALRSFAPDEEPVLWPEHFDIGVAVDEVNYGASPGDAHHGAPYAYVGPWTPRTGDFWNAPFGALRAAAELPDAEALAGFFAAGRAAAR